jgi:hypothetical protein
VLWASVIQSCTSFKFPNMIHPSCCRPFKFQPAPAPPARIGNLAEPDIGYMMTRYPYIPNPDIGHDIGYDIADTRYQDMTRYRVYPISGHTLYRVDPPAISGIPDIEYTRYRVLSYRNIPISGHNVPDIVSCVTRRRVIQCSDVVTFEHDHDRDIGSDVRVAHDVTVACCLQVAGPGPGLAFRLQPPVQNH